MNDNDNHKYAIGVGFGTLSGRALLVDIANGREVATAVGAARTTS